MGRHDIRLRRHRMTSRRIEGHKNYYGVLKKHQRSNRLKRLFKLLILLIFFLSLIFFSYTLLTKIEGEQEKENKNDQAKVETILNH